MTPAPSSPGGIDWRPDPPSGSDISRKALGVVFILFIVLLAAIYWGIMSRRHRNEANERERERSNRVEPATVAESLIRPPAPAAPTVSEAQVLRLAAAAVEGPAQIQQAPAALPPPAWKEPTPEELAAQRYKEAMQAPMYPKRDKDREQVREQVRAQEAAVAVTPRESAEPVLPANASAETLEPDEYTQINMQRHKRAFLEQAEKRSSSNYLPYTRTPQIGLCEIKAGWEIPAVLEQELNSDLPGEAKALVSQSVYDTATGKYLLIPQGARLIGTYNSAVGYGQERMQVVWNRIIFPDGSSINLAGMTGNDAQGNAGMKDKVNRHMVRTFGMAALTSAFVAAYELTRQPNYGNGGYYIPSAGDRAAGAFGGEMVNTAAAMTRRNLSVQPTLKIQAGYKLTVRVNKDMLFDGPYSPQLPAEEQQKPTLRTSR